MLFEKGQKIEKYEVEFPCKASTYAETYRVKDVDGNICFLKLICLAKLDASQYSPEGKVLELEVANKLIQEKFLGFMDTGTLIENGQQYAFIVQSFISGESLADKMNRDVVIPVYEAKQIAQSILSQLSLLHSLDNPIIHNGINPHHVMLDLKAQPTEAKLVGFDNARFLSLLPIRSLITSPFYQAPERFNGVCSVQTDLYAVGALLYQMIFGLQPWYIDLSNYKQEEQIPALLQQRQKPLVIPSMDIFELDESLINIITKALSNHVDDRFQTAEEFSKALKGEIIIQKVQTSQLTTVPKKKKGNGFADVAGMAELKEQLQSDVIQILKQPERAKELGLSIPNGILFYGPPGCGKTFFAERFAEEIGCNYMYTLCSDVASPYIHGGQGKIAALFDEARKKAPTILFLDEVEAMIMDRNKHTNVSEQGEVNEFLAQLNNCGEDGVMVIAATNEPSLIDPAALRAGRLEQKFYIPQPDEETRMELFRVGLRNRKVELGIDYKKLAKLTVNRVSADIKFIIDTAARMVFKRNLNAITEAILEEAITVVEPTVSEKEIKESEKIRDNFQGKSAITKVGFINYK